MTDISTLSYVWHPEEKYIYLKGILEIHGYDSKILDDIIEEYLERERKYFRFYSSKR